MNTAEVDRVARYAPEYVFIVRNGEARTCEVEQHRVFAPNAHPAGCPIVGSLTALECVTAAGSRWYGFERAWINSELRMVVSGFGARDEVRAKWPVAKEE